MKGQIEIEVQLYIAGQLEPLQHDDEDKLRDLKEVCSLYSPALHLSRVWPGLDAEPFEVMPLCHLDISRFITVGQLKDLLIEKYLRTIVVRPVHNFS